MAQRVELTATVSENQLGQRLDQALAELFPDYSRSRIKEWILDQRVLVNGTIGDKPKEKVLGGERIAIDVEIEEEARFQPQDIPLNIVYEDDDIIVINKPAGMPIHPSMNNYYNSLANALAWYYQKQDKPFIFRCCNRLDRDTSGLTVVSKHLVSGSILSTMTKNREVHREYLAVVKGRVTPSSGTICAPLARKEGTIIERMVDFEHGEEAITHYKLIREANGHSLVSLKLETGRTHQIRIHMKYLGFPLIGDYLYNPDMEHMTRQALHSHHMEFAHPITGEWMSFTAPLPADMANVLKD